MRSRMRRRVVAFAVAVASALTILGASAATASALVRGHAAAEMHFGRGGVFPVSGLSGASQVYAAVIAIAAMGLVTWITLRADRRSRARLAPVTSAAPVGHRGPETNGGSETSSAEDRDRKAA
jgi:hypothetical protein